MEREEDKGMERVREREKRRQEGSRKGKKVKFRRKER